MAVTLNDKHLREFVSNDEYTSIVPQIKAAHDLLHNKTGLGNDFVGWVDLPVKYDKDEFAKAMAWVLPWPKPRHTSLISACSGAIFPKPGPPRITFTITPGT